MDSHVTYLGDHGKYVEPHAFRMGYHGELLGSHTLLWTRITTSWAPIRRLWATVTQSWARVEAHVRFVGARGQASRKLWAPRRNCGRVLCERVGARGRARKGKPKPPIP